MGSSGSRTKLRPFLLAGSSLLLFGGRPVAAMLPVATGRGARSSVVRLEYLATRSVSSALPAAFFANTHHPQRHSGRARALPWNLHHGDCRQQRTLGNGPFWSSFSTPLLASANDSGDEIVPTWEYVPYDPSKNNKIKSKGANTRSKNATGRNQKPWTVPKHVRIPDDARIEFSFVRSSGSGGQNVNKLSTKAELRIDLVRERHAWMPAEVQTRLKDQQSNRISREGILTLTSQEHRTQGRNKTEVLNKLRALVLQAWPRPKVRKQRTGISKAAKARNKEFKKRRSETKQNRKRVDW